MRSIRTAKEAVAILRHGGVIAMPTDTIYGLIAIADQRTKSKVIAIKQSPKDKKVLLLVRNLMQAKRIAVMSPRQERFLRLVWPGPVTVVLRSKKVLSGFSEKTLALRIPRNRTLQAILAQVRRPLTATSANLSGKKTPRSYHAVEKHFTGLKSAPDAIFISAKKSASRPSALVACNGRTIHILRQGAMDQKYIQKAWERSALKTVRPK